MRSLKNVLNFAKIIERRNASHEAENQAGRLCSLNVKTEVTRANIALGIKQCGRLHGSNSRPFNKSKTVCEYIRLSLTVTNSCFVTTALRLIALVENHKNICCPDSCSKIAAKQANESERTLLGRTDLLVNLLELIV